MTRDILLNDILSDGAGESSVHGAWRFESHSWHVDIQVDVYVVLGSVFDYVTIACTLRWGEVLVGDYHY